MPPSSTSRRPDLQTQDAAVAEMDRQAAEQDFIAQQQQENNRMQQAQEEAAREAARAQKTALANAKRQGVKVAPDATGAETIQRHPDGQPVYEAGFVGEPQINDKGGAVAYRDARGQRYDVPFDAIRSEPDPTGETFYSFDVNGPDGTKQTMRQPAGTKPLFRVDPGTGSRIVDVTDPATGSVQPRVVGLDPLVANKAAVEKRKNAAQLAQNERSGQAEKLRLQLDEREVFFQPVRDKLKVAQDAADKLAREKITYAQKDGDEQTRGVYQVTELSDGSTMDRKLTQPEEIAKAGAWINNRTATEKALMDAKAEHDPAAAEIQSLKERRASLARESHSESLRAQAEIRRMEEAAKKGSDVTKPDWQQRAESLRSNTRVQSLNAVADLEESGDPLAPDVEQAALPETNKMLQKVWSAGFQGEQPASLLETLSAGLAANNPAQAPKDATAALALAAKSLGISDPGRVTVEAREVAGLPYSALSVDGEEFGMLDTANNRLVLLATQGSLRDRGAEIIANASADGVPVYLVSGEQPYNKAELRGMIADGIAAVSSAASQDDATQALATAGLSPDDLRAAVMAGKLSVQDGRMMAEQFHGIKAVNTTRPAVEAEFGKYLAASKTAKADWEAGNKAAVVNRFMDGLAAKSVNGIAVDRLVLEERRRELLGQHVKEGALSKAGGFLKELIMPMVGIAGQAVAYVPQKIAKWTGYETEAGRLSEQQFTEWMDRTGSFVHKMLTRDEVQNSLEELRQWAVNASPGATPPDEMADKIAGLAYDGYHELTDEAAKALDTSRDTFNINRDPMLQAAMQRYLRTADPAAFDQLASLMMMDARDRKTQGEVSAYVENGRVASAGDVMGRAKGLSIDLTPDKATALIGISRILARTDDPKAAQKLIADAGKIMGLEGEEAAETLERVTADETDDPDSAFGLLKGGFVAGRQELATELVTTGAEAGLAWVTAGSATPEIIAERAASQAAKSGIRAAIRRQSQAAFAKLADSSTAFAKTSALLGKARQTVGTGLANMGEAFAKAGIKPATFGQPLTKLDKVRNAAVQVGKNAAAAAPMEALEEGIAAIGEPDPNAASIGEQMLMGAAGGLVLTPMFAGAAAVGQAWKNRGAGAEWEKRKAGYVEELNRRMESVPGFKPITVADFDAWQGLQDNPAQAQARASYQSALATFEQELALHQDAAAGNATLPFELLAARVQLDSAAKELELSTSSAFMAMDELRALPEAERPLYTATAKAAAGVTDYTEAEAKALMQQSGDNAVVFQQAQVLPGDVAGPPAMRTTGAPEVTTAAPGVYRIPAGVKITLPPALLSMLEAKAPSTVGLMGGGNVAQTAAQPAAKPTKGANTPANESGQEMSATKLRKMAQQRQNELLWKRDGKAGGPDEIATNPRQLSAEEKAELEFLDKHLAADDTEAIAKQYGVKIKAPVTASVQTSPNANATDEVTAAETDESLYARTKAGPERDKAVAERRASAERLARTIIKGDKIVLADGEELVAQVDAIQKTGEVQFVGYGTPVKAADYLMRDKATLPTGEKVELPAGKIVRAKPPAQTPTPPDAAGVAPSPTGKALPAKQLEKITREAIGRIVAKSPKVKALVKETKKAHRYPTGGMWMNPDGTIAVHVPTIIQQLAAQGITDPATAGKRVEALLDEEIRHSANMEAARRLFAGEQSAGRVLRGMSFETWRDAWYGDIWNSHFTDAMRQAVQEAYGDTLPEAEWMRAMEGLRMLDQLRATGSITEAVLLALDAILESLREFLDLVTAGGKKVVEAEIMAIREVLAEYGYEGGTVKPDAKKKPAKAKAQKQEMAKPADSAPEMSPPQKRLPILTVSDATSIKVASDPVDLIVRADAKGMVKISQTSFGNAQTGGSQSNITFEFRTVDGMRRVTFRDDGPRDAERVAAEKQPAYRFSPVLDQTSQAIPPKTSSLVEAPETAPEAAPASGLISDEESARLDALTVSNKDRLDKLSGNQLLQLNKELLRQPSSAKRDAILATEHPDDIKAALDVVTKSEADTPSAKFQGKPAKRAEPSREEWQKTYAKFKRALAKAVKAKDYAEIIKQADAFQAHYEADGNGPFPDTWSDWERHKSDAEMQLARQGTATNPLVVPILKPVTPPRPAANADADYLKAQEDTRAALGGLFSAPVRRSIPQLEVPEERFDAVRTAAKSIIAAKIRTPEAFAKFLDDTFPGGKARPYSEAIWDVMGVWDKSLRGTHDWTRIYGDIDQPLPDVQEPAIDEAPAALNEQNVRKLIDDAIRQYPSVQFEEHPKDVVPTGLGVDSGRGVIGYNIESLISFGRFNAFHGADAMENVRMSIDEELAHAADVKAVKFMGSSYAAHHDRLYGMVPEEVKSAVEALYPHETILNKMAETLRMKDQLERLGQTTEYTLGGFFETGQSRYTDAIAKWQPAQPIRNHLVMMRNAVPRPSIALDSATEIPQTTTDETQPGIRDGDQTPLSPDRGGQPGEATQPGQQQSDSDVGVGVSDNAPPAVGGRNPGGVRKRPQRNGPPAIQDDAGGRAGESRPSEGGNDSELPGTGTGVAEPEHTPGRSNYWLADPESIVGGGPKARFARNRKALETLEALQEENRDPTPAELETLAAYTGWGAFGQELFKGTHEKSFPAQGWEDESEWLKGRLGKADWEAAQESILNAHYTDPPTVTAMWDMIRRMGFTGGRVLEPALGTGNFFSLMPRDLMASSQLSGIELDPTTAAIAKYLHPQANIRQMGYEESTTADSFYDLIVGNWPFKKGGPADRRYNHLNASLHDYFFVKAIDQVRPGGLVVGITSAGTMDKKSKAVRAYLASRGELVASFRLPTGAFGKYAGTAVVTDIVILKKRETPLQDISGETWVESVKDDRDRDFFINAYYQTPQGRSNILGNLDFGTGSTYGRPSMIVKRAPDFEQVLPAVSQRLPENIMQPWKPGEKKIQYIANTTSFKRQNAIVVQGDELYQVNGENLGLLQDLKPWKTKDAAKRLADAKSLLNLRSLLDGLMDAYRVGEDTTKQREALLAAYTAHIQAHGPLNKSKILDLFRRAGDPTAADILNMEEMTAKGPRPRAILTQDIMRKRTLDAKGSIADAYALARNNSLDFRVADVAEAAGVPESEAQAFLMEQGQIYRTPQGVWEPSDVYLAGNVRQKLREAQAAQVEGIEGMERNIAALEAIQPADTPYFEIEVQMGAAWIPISDYQDFIASILQAEPEHVEIVKSSSGYNVRLVKSAADSALARSQWGTEDVNPSNMFAAAMNSTPLKVYSEPDKDGVRTLLTEETEAANLKRDSIREELVTWLWSDPNRTARLVREYNESMNSIVTPKRDGSHLRLEGLALTLGRGEFDFRQHQRDAVWRFLLDGKGVGAHEVGTGKTFTIAGLAMEGRRLGVLRKPMILAHNANSSAISADISQAYPAAKVLYLDDLGPKARENAMRQIKLDDWDAVVVPHSLISRFALKRETMMRLVQPQIDQLEAEFIASLEELDGDFSDLSFDDDFADVAKALKFTKGAHTAKDLMKRKIKIMEDIEKRAMASSREGAISFEELGIDAIIVDEAHIFKKIPLATRKNFKGLQKEMSGAGFQLQLMTDYLKSINNGKGVFLFTGTPVTNTLNEVFNMMRFVMSDEFTDAQIANFDDWFNAFAQATSDIELTSGGTFEPIERVLSFINIPELARMAGRVFDVVRAIDMPEFKPRVSDEGWTDDPVGRPRRLTIPVIAEMSPDQRQHKRDLEARYREYQQLDGKGKMKRRKFGGDVPAIIETDGRKSALDHRYFDLAANDHAGSKLNLMVGNIMEHHREHPKATQMVFQELGVNDFVDRERTIRDAVGNPVMDANGKPMKEKYRVPSFNLLRDMVEKLVAQGVKPEEIAIFHNMSLDPVAERPNDVLRKVRRISAATPKEELAAMMNRGEVRVAFGSTQTMGTGVNAQEWLRAMHHLDAPWTPGEFEQRNGRGWRQGNKWNTVMEYRYFTEESHDGKMWQTLLNKVRFIERFTSMLQGKGVMSRVLEGEGADTSEDGSVSDFEQSFSSAAGDPRLLVRAKLEKEVQKLQRRKQVFINSISSSRDKIRDLDRWQERDAANLPKFEQDHAAFLTAKEPFSITFFKGRSGRDLVEGLAALQKKGATPAEVEKFQRGEVVFTERKDATDALERLPRYTTRQRIGEFGAFGIYAESTFAGTKFEITGPSGYTYNFEKPSMQSLEATLGFLKRRANSLREDMAKRTQELTALQDSLGKPWSRESDLVAKEKALDQIRLEITASPTPAPSWLRHGAPTGSLIYVRNAEGGLDALDVAAHRWDANDFWLLVDNGTDLVPVRYSEALTETGSRLFQDYEHQTPSVQPAEARPDAGAVNMFTQDQWLNVIDAEEGRSLRSAPVRSTMPRDRAEAIVRNLTGKEQAGKLNPKERAALDEARARLEPGGNVPLQPSSPRNSPPTTHIMPDGYELTGPGMHMLASSPVRAYHGTPHKVDRFRMDKIGTGEGAQAYGWGLYFAESQGVARDYQNRLVANKPDSFAIITLDGVELPRKWSELLDVVTDADERDAIRGIQESGLSYTPTFGSNAKNKKVAAALEKLRGRVAIKQPAGNLYTVELLPDESEFLDWDKPLSEQSEKVKAALASVPLQKYDKSVHKDPRAVDIYSWADSNPYGGDTDSKASAEALLKAGIPGIRFLDGNSRSDGSGTSNYVIFDENLIRILEENGKPVSEAPLASAPVSSSQDAEYLAAVEAGDMATAQRLDEAARAANPDAKFVDAGEVQTNRIRWMRDADAQIIFYKKQIETLPTDAQVEEKYQSDRANAAKFFENPDSPTVGEIIKAIQSGVNVPRGTLADALRFRDTERESAEKEIAKYESQKLRAPKGRDDTVFKTGQPTLTKVFHATPFGRLDKFDDDMLGGFTGAPSAKMAHFFAGSQEVAKTYFADHGWILDQKGFFRLNADQQKELVSAVRDELGDSPSDQEVANLAEELFDVDYDAGKVQNELHEVFVALKNPLVHDFKGEGYRDVSFRELLEKAEEAGHDGVIMANTYDAGPAAQLDDKGEPTNIVAVLRGHAQQIKSADPITRDASGNVIPLSERFNPASDSILYSAPAPKPNRATQAMRDIIESLPPPHREVLRDLLVNGMSIEDAATTHGISETAVGNILRRGEAHIRLMMDRNPTKPAVQVQDGIVKATDGRPDLAMSGNAAVAAVDQRRMTPEEVTHAEMQELATRLFDVAPAEAENLVVRWMDSGTTVLSTDGMPDSIKAIVGEAQARNAAEMLMTAAAKMLVARKTLEGGNSTQLARLIYLYRNTGTEQARALGMRRDPFDTPEERAAMYLSEALLTPPDAIRNELRRNPANRDRILAAWAKRADEIKAEMLAHGIDLDATFADHAEEQKLIEETIPEPVKPALARAPKKTRQLVKALLQGMTPSEAIKAAGLSAKAAFKAYQDFRASLNQTGTEAAQAMRDQLLRSAPAPGADFAANLGLPDLTEAEWLEAVQTDKPLRTTTETEKLKQHREKAKKAGTLDLKNPVSTRKAVRAIEERKSNAFEKISEFWRASILSGPQTHVVNLVSGLTYGTYEASFKKLAAGAQADIARMFGAKPDAASLADIPAMIAASLPSIKLAFLDGISAWKSETRAFENYALQLRDDNGELFKEQFNPALKGTLGKVMRGISFRLMGAADEFVKSFFTRIEVAAQARQIARNEGKTGLELAQAIQELMEPGSLAWERALGQAKKITFQTEIGSGSASIDAIDGLAQLISRTKKGDFGKPLKGLAHFTFPFVDTPTNIFKAGVTMSPVGGLLALVDMVRAYQRYHKGNAEEAAKIYNAARALDDLTNQIVAWGFILGLSSLVKPGDDEDETPFITGTIPWRSTSPGERELAYRTAPPQSIRIGDRWISYKRLDPFASALAFTVDAIREWQSGKPIDEVWGKIGLGMLRNMQDKTFLQGVSDVVNAVQDPERFGTKWATNIATGFIPNLIRQPIRTADDVFRETDLPNDLGFWDALGRRMGYGVYPQGAMPAITVWGQPASKDTGTGGPNTDWMLRLLSPADMRAANVDMLDVALLRYNATHQDGDPKALFGVTAPSRELQRTIGGQVVKISLDDAEYEDFITKAGMAARAAIGNTYDGRDLTEQDVERIKDILQRAQGVYRDAAFVAGVQKRGGLNALAK